MGRAGLAAAPRPSKLVVTTRRDPSADITSALVPLTVGATVVVLAAVRGTRSHPRMAAPTGCALHWRRLTSSAAHHLATAAWTASADFVRGCRITERARSGRIAGRMTVLRFTDLAGPAAVHSVAGSGRSPSVTITPRYSGSRVFAVGASARRAPWSTASRQATLAHHKATLGIHTSTSARWRMVAVEIRPGTRCARSPSRCGYPSSSTAGVPSTDTLTSTGELTIHKNGTVVSGRLVNGGINVEADNVTIKDTEVVTNDPEGGAITVVHGAVGTVIKNTTVRGVDAGAHSVEYAVDNQSDSSLRAIDDSFYNCTECFSGPGLLADSWVSSNATVAGAHYEATYYGGGSEYLTIEHDTLINAHPQTAVVYAGPDFGPVVEMTIADSLLDGGGYTIYGGQSAQHRSATRGIRILYNRIATTTFPRGGSDGWLAYFGVNDPDNALLGNIWDGNGATLSSDGSRWIDTGPSE